MENASEKPEFSPVNLDGLLEEEGQWTKEYARLQNAVADNPTDAALRTSMDKAFEKWQACRRRTDEFVESERAKQQE